MTAWSNPGNGAAEDGSLATCAVMGLVSSHYLMATGFGFSIPSGATMNGITVEVKRKAGTGDIQDGRVRIVKGRTVGSTDRRALGNWSTTLGYQSYGSSSDLWGETWTDTDINSGSFGLALAATSGFGDTASVDQV